MKKPVMFMNELEKREAGIAPPTKVDAIPWIICLAVIIGITFAFGG